MKVQQSDSDVSHQAVGSFTIIGDIVVAPVVAGMLSDL